MLTPALHHPRVSCPAARVVLGSRRAFAFLTVLMLMGVAAVILGVALQRASLRSAITQRQLEGYRQHHEMLGIRDYAELWLGRKEQESPKLKEFAESGEVAHRLALDDGVVLLFTIADGQGTALRSLAGIQNAATRRWLVGVLSRLPKDQPRFTRRSGPPQISLRSAPDEVLAAIAGENAELYSALVTARGRDVKSAEEIQQSLERSGVELGVAQMVGNYLVSEPSLWRLNVEAVHPDGIRRYTLLAEKQANLIRVHEWRPVGEAEASASALQTNKN